MNRSDPSGNAWDIVFDIGSLILSVAELAANPTDLWALASFSADLVDVLLPLVSGLGETVRAIKAADAVSDTVQTLHRPYIRKSTRAAVEEAADRADDLVSFIDANTGEVIIGKYDLGHKPGHEFWRERDRAMELGWTQKQFNDYMNNPDFYQIEDPINNRSHRYEMR